MFDDLTTTALRSAATGLALRQRVNTDNIANLQTPGFLAGRVSFESALAQAVSGGSGDSAPSVARSLEPTRTDGNNVNLDTETLIGTDTNMRYQLVLRALSDRMSMMRTVLGGGA